MNRVFGFVCYVFVPDHLRSKFDKKAIRCIFVGYVLVKKKDGNVVTPQPTANRCYVSRNVVFDEASSWWSPQQVILPDSKEIEEKLQERLGEQADETQPSSEAIEPSIPLTSKGESEKDASPWQTGVH